MAWTKDTGRQPVTEVGFDHKEFAIHTWRSVRETYRRTSIELISRLVGHRTSTSPP